MTGCLGCGAPTPRRYCRGCARDRRRDGADVGDVVLFDCPRCDGPTSAAGVLCADCRRDSDDVGGGSA